MLLSRKWLGGFVVLVVFAFAAVARADQNQCGVCGKPPGATIYTTTDKVSHERVFLCHDCAACPDECYICSLPVRANFTSLPDGRFLCSRDAKTAVLDEAKAKEVCAEVVEALDRLFSRFWSLPSKNVQVALVDRVSLFDEFVVVGNNFECPDVLGYIHSSTNEGSFQHAVNLMSALPRAQFQATCAHEYTHAWVFEHVPASRRKTLSRDAHEGFCELVAYLLLDSLHEEDQKQVLLRNTYTRGQVHLFIEAEKQFGFNDILDWVRWGVNPRLRGGNLADVRNVEMPRQRSAPLTNFYLTGAAKAAAPDTLLLKGVSGSKGQFLALINNQTLAAGESGTVRVGTTNVLVRCLSVSERSARIQVVPSGKELELQLTPNR
jgi:hypothetical protein